jgi:hypothetical protein
MLAATTRLTWHLEPVGVSAAAPVDDSARKALTATTGVRIMSFRMSSPGCRQAVVKAASTSTEQGDAVTLLAPVSRMGIRSSGQRVAAGAVAALALANLHVPGRPATLCPFRALTGLPCPFCGGTTAAVHLGRFDLLGALRANPVVVLGAVIVAAMPAMIAVRSSRGGARRPAISPRTFRVAIVVAVVFSEVWQLFRFGIL